MAMALNPGVQKKAQAELDSVLGGRLPEFNDRLNLPYVNAVVKESMRWQLVTPLGMLLITTPILSEKLTAYRSRTYVHKQ
jgi:cytochrome P450